MGLTKHRDRYYVEFPVDDGKLYPLLLAVGADSNAGTSVVSIRRWQSSRRRSLRRNS